MGDNIQVINRDNTKLAGGKVTKLFVTRGTSKSEVTSASAGTKNTYSCITHYISPLFFTGDIVTLAGVNAFVSDTICDTTVEESIKTPKLDPPTISMTFSVNDSPIAGKVGKFLTSSHIKERLLRETEVRKRLSRSCKNDLTSFH